MKQGAVAALHFMLTNAVKHDVDEKSFVQEVLQLGLPKENTDAIAKQYRENKDRLREKFAEESYRVSRLLSVDWRVDQVLASSETAATNSKNASMSATVHLNLRVDTKPQLGALPVSTDSSVAVLNDRVKALAFEMSAKKLDVLIHELSQAQNLMESIEN